MIINPETLQQIAVDVCQSMLGLPLQLIEPQPSAVTPLLMACVEIRGDQVLVVEILAHEDLTQAIAEAMFAADRGSLSRDEIRDAFGEVANMIGGNVKGMMGAEANLSLPFVSEAAEDDLTDQLSRISATFECCGYPLTCVIREAAIGAKSKCELAAVS